MCVCVCVCVCVLCMCVPRTYLVCFTVYYARQVKSRTRNPTKHNETFHFVRSRDVKEEKIERKNSKNKPSTTTKNKKHKKPQQRQMTFPSLGCHMVIFL